MVAARQRTAVFTLAASILWIALLTVLEGCGDVDPTSSGRRPAGSQPTTSGTAGGTTVTTGSTGDTTATGTTTTTGGSTSTGGATTTGGNTMMPPASTCGGSLPGTFMAICSACHTQVGT